ncbi:hypothetical protein [Arthrobacter oryzae]|uniref:hypothetical protein n=1 Tax=Arthrobacter oryzae TaxID=409290 RepID=UPI0030C959C4
MVEVECPGNKCTTDHQALGIRNQARFQKQLAYLPGRNPACGHAIAGVGRKELVVIDSRSHT